MHRIEIPPTRVAQAVDSLREALTDQLWTECLPGERILSRDLGISRPTLRAALKVLEDQHWIRTSVGRRRLILPRHSPCIPLRNVKNVILLAKESEKKMTHMSLLYLESLRSRLQSAGWELEFRSHPVYGRNSVRLVKGLLPRPDAAAAFILFSLPQAMHRLCHEQGYPAIVAGSRAEGFPLPSLDIDYHGTLRHAVGTLVGRGHRRIALLIPNGKLAGDLMAKRGFAEAAEAYGARCESARIVEHHDDTDDLETKVRTLMRCPSVAPTGIVVGRAVHAVTALCALNAMGLRVPQDVSLVCRDFEPILHWTVPRIAHYTLVPERLAARLAKLAGDIGRGESVPPKAHTVAPDFEAAASLGPPRARPAIP